MFYFWARGLSGFSYQIAAVAVGWQVYALSRSAFDLGIVGSYIFAAVAVFGAASAFESPAAAALFAGAGSCTTTLRSSEQHQLDLFAVLLDGATALLPSYARDILHTGPWGLGVLRGAPASAH